MIIVQTPLRISLFGGGTDFRSFFLEEGGCVLSTTIDKYIFVTIKNRFDRKLRVGWTQTEMVDSVSEIHHELIRESLIKTGITYGVEITTMGDIPSEGSGLGSSSTVTVGALHAMHIFLNELVTAQQLAHEACEIEIGTLKKPIGIQDQYIAAYGGFRFIEFQTTGNIASTRMPLSSLQKRKIGENILMFYTGQTRQSSTILTEQRANIQSRMPILREMKKIAYIARDEIEKGNLEAIGELLHESWQLKKQLASKISNSAIDEMYGKALRAGATGGKITGAGGGGFLLLYCPPGNRKNVREALSDFQELPIRIEDDGSKVIFNYRH